MAAMSDLMIDDGPALYYDADFRAVLEDHMSFLRNNSSTRTLAVMPGEAYRYECDFYGFLSRYNIPVHLHWVTLRMNKLTSPEQFSADTVEVLIPDPTVVDRIRQSHESTRRVT